VSSKKSWVRPPLRDIDNAVLPLGRVFGVWGLWRRRCGWLGSRIYWVVESTGCSPSPSNAPQPFVRGLFQKIAKLSLEAAILQVGRNGNCKIRPLNRFVVGLRPGQPSFGNEARYVDQPQLDCNSKTYLQNVHKSFSLPFSRITILNIVCRYYKNIIRTNRQRGSLTIKTYMRWAQRESHRKSNKNSHHK